jgi:hypothetical protein
MKAPKREREIFKKLIPIYEKTINEMPKDDFKYYLIRKRLLMGLCYASDKILNDFCLYESKWLQSKCKTTHIFTTPSNLDTYEKALESLQFRLDFMKKYI